MQRVEAPKRTAGVTVASPIEVAYALIHRVDVKVAPSGIPTKPEIPTHQTISPTRRDRRNSPITLDQKAEKPKQGDTWGYPGGEGDAQKAAKTLTKQGEPTQVTKQDGETHLKPASKPQQFEPSTIRLAKKDDKDEKPPVTPVIAPPEQILPDSNEKREAQQARSEPNTKPLPTKEEKEEALKPYKTEEKDK